FFFYFFFCIIIMMEIRKLYFFFFFFKQKTAYEITTGDWSSDVCSSDLRSLESGERDDAGPPCGDVAVEHDDLLEAGQRAFHLEHLRDLRGGRAEHRDGFRVPQDVFGLLGGQRGIDRDVSRAGAEARVV